MEPETRFLLSHIYLVKDGTPYATHQIGVELIYAVAICLLSQRERAVLFEATAEAATLVPVGPSHFPTITSSRVSHEPIPSTERPRRSARIAAMQTPRPIPWLTM
jgi:hypothetical protein